MLKVSLRWLVRVNMYTKKVGMTKSLLRDNIDGIRRAGATMKSLYDSPKWEHSGWSRSAGRSWKGHRKNQWRNEEQSARLNKFDFLEYEELDCELFSMTD